MEAGKTTMHMDRTEQDKAFSDTEKQLRIEHVPVRGLIDVVEHSPCAKDVAVKGDQDQRAEKPPHAAPI